MLYKYALIIAVVCSAIIVLGFLLRKKQWIAIACIASCFTASPIVTFTRGAAGAITASDIAGLVLLVCIFAFPAFSHNKIPPIATQNWTNRVWQLLLLTLLSVFLIGPIYNFFFITSEFLTRVQSISGVPLPILMAGFRATKLLGLASFIIFFKNTPFNRADFYLILKWTLWLLALLAIAEVLTKLSIYDLSLYVAPDAEYAGPRVLGFSKATIGRLCAFGVFLVMMRLYRSANPFMILIMCILVLGVLFAGSRGALLVILTGMLVFVLYGRLPGLLTALVIVGVAIISATIAVSLADGVMDRFTNTLNPESISNVASRKDIWIGTLMHLFHHPYILIAGVGAFNFSYAINLDQLPIEHAHNDYLTVTTELGLLGLIFFLRWISGMVRSYQYRIKVYKGRDRWENLSLFAGFIGLIVASIFESTLYTSMGTMPMLRILLSLWIIYELVCRRENVKQPLKPNNTIPVKTCHLSPSKKQD